MSEQSDFNLPEELEGAVKAIFSHPKPDQAFVDRLGHQLSDQVEQFTTHQRKVRLPVSPLAWGVIGIIFILFLVWGIRTLIPRVEPSVSSQSTPSPMISPLPSMEPTLLPTQATGGEPSIDLPALAQMPIPWSQEAITSMNADQITELAHWGRGMISEVVWAPDGNSFAVASATGIYIFDSATFQILDIFDNDSFVNNIAYSPDGTKLASFFNVTTVKIWDVASGIALQTLEGKGDYVTGLAFSPEGVILGSGNSNAEPIKWSNGEVVSGDPYAIQGPITLWDPASGQELRTLCGSAGFFTFSPDWSILATVSGYQAIKLWDTTTGEELRTLAGSIKHDIFGITFSSDGGRLAAWSGNNTIKVWDVATGNEQITLSVGDYLSNVTFLPDGKTIAYIADSRLITVLDIASGQLVRTFGDANDEGNILLSPDGKMLLNKGNNEIKLFDIASGKELHKLDWPSYRASSLAVSPDGRTVASGLSSGNIKLMDAANGQELRTLAAEVSSLAFSPDGGLLASSGDNMTRLWDLATGKELYSSEGLPVGGWGKGGLPSVDFSPDGKLLAFAGPNGQVRLWDIANHVELQPLGEEGDALISSQVSAVVFSPDGKILASGYAVPLVPDPPHPITLWDSTSGQELRTLEYSSALLPNHVSRLEFSPDGKILAAGYWEGEITMWDVASGSELYTWTTPWLQDNPDEISSLAFSTDGNVLAIGCENLLNIPLLDAVSGKELVTLPSASYVLAFSLDGKMLISNSYDGVIRLWGIAP